MWLLRRKARNIRTHNQHVTARRVQHERGATHSCPSTKQDSKTREIVQCNEDFHCGYAGGYAEGRVAMQEKDARACMCVRAYVDACVLVCVSVRVQCVCAPEQGVSEKTTDKRWHASGRE